MFVKIYLRKKTNPFHLTIRRRRLLNVLNTVGLLFYKATVTTFKGAAAAGIMLTMHYYRPM